MWYKWQRLVRYNPDNYWNLLQMSLMINEMVWRAALHNCPAMTQRKLKWSNNWAPWPLPFKALLTDFWICYNTKHSFHTQPACLETQNLLVFSLKYCFCQRSFQGSNSKHPATIAEKVECFLFIISEGCYSLGEDMQMIRLDVYVQYLPWMTLF